jgi:hypothetical protein
MLWGNQGLLLKRRYTSPPRFAPTITTNVAVPGGIVHGTHPALTRTSNLYDGWDLGEGGAVFGELVRAYRQRFRVMPQVTGRPGHAVVQHLGATIAAH